MSVQPFLYVANWKMKLSYNQAYEFCQVYKDAFDQLAQAQDSKIILCPSFDVLHVVTQQFKGSEVFIGAQTCSSHSFGAYTGEVAAESIAQIGCRYCIVGHSERRLHCAETDQDVAQKIERLLEVGLIPIVCVGETREQFERKETEKVIKRQIGVMLKSAQRASQICVAYEPIWSIGTGEIPTNEVIESVFEQIYSFALEAFSEIQITLLYGGSVHGENIAKLKKISQIGGFLIGDASLNFQKFEKIVT